MNKKETDIQKVLEKHSMWLSNKAGGERANLRGANLRYADLRYADLRYADLRYADLQGANLRGANLRYADLRYANLRYANLQDADLRYADLQGADLQGADLQGADLDFSSGVSYHCSSTGIVGDHRLFAQMIYHLTRQDWQHLQERERKWLDSIPECIRDSFLKYRDDIK